MSEVPGLGQLFKKGREKTRDQRIVRLVARTTFLLTLTIKDDFELRNMTERKIRCDLTHTHAMITFAQCGPKSRTL